MRARIILRTHYQADEPRAIIAAATECSSPTQSRHEETVAAGLKKWAKANDYKLSIPGAVYAVGNARSLGLLNASHRWTATGLAFAYIDNVSPSVTGRDALTLTAQAERLYLRCYLENAGALLIKFGQWLIGRGGTTDDELRNGSVIEGLLIQALDEYLRIATDIRDRTIIRKERERLTRSAYASSTKRHKRYPLLTTMARLRLLVFNKMTEQRTGVSPDPDKRLVRLLAAIPDVTTLERACRGRALEAVIDTLAAKTDQTDRPGCSNTATLVSDAYRFAIDRGLQACPLSYLDDLLFAYALVDTQTSGKRMSAEDVLEPLHKQYPLEVRFHVDRRGRRAFVLIGAEPARTLEKQLRRF